MNENTAIAAKILSGNLNTNPSIIRPQSIQVVQLTLAGVVEPIQAHKKLLLLIRN